MKQLDHVVSSKMWQTSVSQTETKHPLADTYPQDNIYKFGSLPASSILTLALEVNLQKHRLITSRASRPFHFGQVMSSAQWPNDAQPHIMRLYYTFEDDLSGFQDWGPGIRQREVLEHLPDKDSQLLLVTSRQKEWCRCTIVSIYV